MRLRVITVKLMTRQNGSKCALQLLLIVRSSIVMLTLCVPAACLASTVATPTFSPVAGTYTSAQTVTISDTTSGATLYYTTDGSTPTTSSTHYTGSITVSATETIKAIGTKSGYTQSAVGSAAYTINLTTATPTVSPAAGTYTSIQTVTISDSTPSSSIYYTIDGSTPTTSSTHYAGAITVSASETIKAIATATGYAQSAVGSAVYTINLTAATPTFSPVAGTYTSIQTVTISDSTPSSSIYYTTNGSTPTTSSTLYTGVITVSATETVKAIAAATGYVQSAIGSAAYTVNLTAATPTFSPAAGTYTSIQTVTISDTTPNSTVYYTTNGSTPTTSSAQYTSPLTVSATETIKAIATASGYAQSAVGSAAYTINLAAATPTFSPGAGTYTSAQTVTIGDSTSGATIYYTTNGSTPTTNSTKYTSAITVSASETVKAIATAAGFSQSAVGSAAYVITPTVATPTFSPGTGSYSTTQTVSISDATSGATIYYTTDGSTPTTGSPRYSATITVNTTETINAIATKSGYANSAVGTATYTITTPADPTPAFSPVANTFLYANAPTVSISDADPNATIYYTTNGSTPTTSSSVYSGSVYIGRTTTLKALATDSGYLNSSIASAVYTIVADPPSFSLTSGSYVGAQTLTLWDDTGGSPHIYYTTDGTTPTTSSTLYSGPITVSSSETIEAIASSSGYQSSPASSATYTITSSPTVPTFSLMPGTYNSPQFVTMSTPSQNATIYYTITAGSTGTTPTFLSTAYTGGAVTIGTTETIEAIAVTPDYSSSPVATATYSFPLQAPSATTLSVSSQGNAVTSITAGSTVTLTASVASIGTSVTSGLVNFCNAVASYCGDVEVIGTAELTSNGTATVHIRPNIGIHSYQAVFAGTWSYGTSTSSAAQLTVTGLYPTTTTIATTGSMDSYSAVATVMGAGSGSIAPTGTVSFVDASNANAVLTTATLSGAAETLTPVTGSTYATGNHPSNVAIGDVNGDGTNDLAIMNSVDGTVTILLGNGDGTFRAATGSPVTVGGSGLLGEGDFNGDGNTDLIILAEESIVVLLGHGDGTFANPVISSCDNSGASLSIAVGDFNRDGRLDLALAADNLLTVMLGNGDGTFIQGISSPTGMAPSVVAGGVAEGDFNGDGQIDLVFFGAGSNAISVLLNNGDGTFQLGSTDPISVGLNGYTVVSAVTVADINGDGEPDLVTTNYVNTTFSIFLGNGDGSFTLSPSSPVIAEDSPTDATAGDFNLDGAVDVVVSSRNSGAIFFSWGSPLVNLPSVSVTSTFLRPAADFNGDGVPDWIKVNSSANTVTIWMSELAETATATATGLSPFGNGTHNVTASYSGDSNYASSNSGAASLLADTINQAPMPTFTPAAGIYTSTQAVSINEGTSGATIYYTTDGTTPTTSSSVYSGPITVTPTETIQAVATAPGYVQSAVGIATYSLPPAPVFSPIPGIYAIAQTVTISDVTQGATIYYTTDGSAPTALSPVVTGPLTISSTETLKAIAITPGGSQSAVASATYTIKSSTSTAAPVATPLAGVYLGAQNITLTDATAGARIYYTTDGTTPTTTSNVYSGRSISVSSSETVEMLATAPGYLPSPVVTVQYTIVNGPTITGVSPNMGPIGTQVTISGFDFGAAQGASTVQFNGVAGMPTSWSDTQIVVPVPNGATTGNITVTAQNQSSNGAPFSVGTSASDLEIVSPVSGAIMNPGETVSVSVQSIGGNSYSNAIAIGSAPMGFGSLLSAVPGQSSLAIPSNIPLGAYPLTASGITASGQTVDSDSISIDVERSDLPNTISAIMPSMTFRAPGGTAPLILNAVFADGSVLDVTRSSYVTYSSATPSVASIGSNGIVTALSPGYGILTAAYVMNGQTVQASVPITVDSGPVSASTYALSFGDVSVGTSSAPQQVTLTNISIGAVSIVSLATTGEFSETDDCISSSPLANNATCNVNVTFSPTATGPRNGTLVVTNSLSGTSLTIQLSGIGQ
jgi:Chitobiase/beta-hexosaminidase C-terminal domain/FG-GAP-like repeat